MITLNIARDFSSTPGGRTPEFGPKSGQEFRAVLVRAMEGNDEVVEVVLDGVEGYGSSFLDEVFGGIVRLGRWTSAEVMRRVRPVAHDPEYETYVHEISSYMREAAEARA